jgi:hypothetical protein
MCWPPRFFLLRSSGYYYSGGTWRGFIYDHGTLSTLNVPGSIQTLHGSLNEFGQVAGTYRDKKSKDHIFIRAANGSYQDLGIFGVNPSALATNDLGRVLIGTYDDVHLIFHT